METVVPKDFEGWSLSLSMLFGIGPKFKIQCGTCGIWFSKRIELVDEPPARCPYCGVVNILPLEI